MAARLALVSLVLLGPAAVALTPSPAAGPSLSLVTMPYRGERNLPDLSEGPAVLERGGLAGLLEARGCRLKPVTTVALSPQEQKAYGEWNRLALANGQLAEVVAADRKAGFVPVGLLANCSSLLGMLAGLQHSGPTPRPLRVGLVFIDAHADFNTPETTLSGMLGGMPVAIAAGHCLTRMRLKAGLDPALPERHIVLAGVRDTDPLEQARLDRSSIGRLTVDDLRRRTPALTAQLLRLEEQTDVIYVHVDMDVLDPREVPGHPLAVPDGPTSAELAAAIAEMFAHEKVAALGIASTPFGDRDSAGVSRKAAYALVLAAVDGLEKRTARR